MGCGIDTVKLMCEFWQMLFVKAPKCLNQVNCVSGELNKKMKIKMKFFLDTLLTHIKRVRYILPFILSPET
jgi:hypothetical protein